MLDHYKLPVCGPGRCTTDRYGEVLCSIVPKGAAAIWMSMAMSSVPKAAQKHRLAPA